jgi:hypothetical protein
VSRVRHSNPLKTSRKTNDKVSIGQRRHSHVYCVCYSPEKNLNLGHVTFVRVRKRLFGQFMFVSALGEPQVVNEGQEVSGKPEGNYPFQYCLQREGMCQFAVRKYYGARSARLTSDIGISVQRNCKRYGQEDKDGSYNRFRYVRPLQGLDSTIVIAYPAQLLISRHQNSHLTR